MSNVLSLLAVIIVGQGSPAPTCQRSAGIGHWSCHRAIPGKTCVRIEEPSDPDTWGDNYFCTDSDLGLKWSFHEPIMDMRGTQISVREEPPEHWWTDNFLCLPSNSPWKLTWSMFGPIEGKDCVQWLEPSDAHGWSDNYLCLEK